ncbi:hypothetical protein TDB9533_03300 [Thalassocella blandensis]|nr:hypothetical protein TDB9533_03300 [Thalassocella blandensis]
MVEFGPVGAMLQTDYQIHEMDLTQRSSPGIIAPDASHRI